MSDLFSCRMCGKDATDENRDYCDEHQKTPKTTVRLEIIPQDFWIGLFWRKTAERGDLWICLLPCLPIHFSWKRGAR